MFLVTVVPTGNTAREDTVGLSAHMNLPSDKTLEKCNPYNGCHIIMDEPSQYSNTGKLFHPEVYSEM